MGMHSPPHPGEFVREVYLESLQVSARQIAARLKVTPSTFQRFINGESHVTPELAQRLAETLGRSPESWLAMQESYDLWRAKERVKN